MEWLATEDVHDVLMEWRELLQTKSWLDQLPRDLNALEEVTEEQQRRGNVARQLLYENELIANRDRLAGEITALFGAGEKGQARVRFDDGSERKLLTRFLSAQ